MRDSPSTALTVPAMFLAAAREYPARTFLRWMQGGRAWRWSYAEAAGRIAELCDRLGEHGVGPGDRVVVYTGEAVPSILLHLACAHLGAVFAPFDTRSTPALCELCQKLDAAAVLTTLDRAAEVRDVGLSVVAIGAGGEPATDDPEPGRPFPDGAMAALERLARDLTGDSLYMLQPTSGTTGGSKLVMRRHRAFARVSRVLGADLGLDRAAEPAQRILVVQALTHGFGQYLLATGLALAAELSVTSRIDTATPLGELRELDPTYVGFTPRVIRALVQDNGGAAAPRRLLGPSARLLLTGGARSDDDLLRLLHDQGLQIVEVYGASEFSLVAATRPGQWEPGWVGPVLPDAELRTAPDGELLARTSVMMAGYHGEAELTRAAFTDDGFYRTGDRVEIDGRGMLRYMTRARDMFNLFDGSNVSPAPGEDRMAALPWVEQVVLVGDQRPFVAALVVPHASLREPLAALSGALRRQVEVDVGRLNCALEPGARIRRVALLDEPLAAEHYQVVANGKLRRVRSAIGELEAGAIAALYGTKAAAPQNGRALPLAIIDVPGAGEERRRSTRTAARFLLLFRAGDEMWLATAADISRTGLLAESQLVPPVGQRLTVEIVEPWAGAADGAGAAGPVRLESSVVRHAARGFAVEFTDREHSRRLLGHRLAP